MASRHRTPSLLSVVVGAASSTILSHGAHGNLVLDTQPGPEMLFAEFFEARAIEVGSEDISTALGSVSNGAQTNSQKHAL